MSRRRLLMVLMLAGCGGGDPKFEEALAAANAKEAQEERDKRGLTGRLLGGTQKERGMR